MLFFLLWLFVFLLASFFLPIHVWYTFWLTVILVTAVWLLSAPHRPRKVLIELKSNNNRRLALLWLLFLVFLGSALTAGPVKPLWQSDDMQEHVAALKQRASNLAQETKENKPLMTGLKGLLNGGQVAPKVSTTQRAETAPSSPPLPTRPAPQYASWAHWGLALFFGLWALAYIPVAFSDDVMAAWREARERRQARRNVIAANISPRDLTFTKAVAAGMIAIFVYKLLQRLFAKVSNGFLKNSFLKP